MQTALLHVRTAVDGLLTFIPLLVAVLASPPAISLLDLRLILRRWLTVATGDLTSVCYPKFLRITAIPHPVLSGSACVPVKMVIGMDVGASPPERPEPAVIDAPLDDYAFIIRLMCNGD